MKTKILSRALFILILLAEVAIGHIKGFVFDDGISRVASAFYVLYIRPPHLAAIGTTWNPSISPQLMEIMLFSESPTPFKIKEVSGDSIRFACPYHIFV
jgi:hypothetical protein